MQRMMKIKICMAYYEGLKEKFSRMPEISKGWTTNKNWVIVTPIETGIAPQRKRDPTLG